MATPNDGPSKSGKDSVEYKALRKLYRKLVEVVSQRRIAAALFENEVIEDDMLELFTTSLTGTDIGGKIMKNVFLSIKLQPEKHFESFCKSLEVEDSLKDVLKELKSTHAKFVEEQTAIRLSDTTLNEIKGRSEPQISEDFWKLRHQLHTFNQALKSASNPDKKVAYIDCFKDQIQQYIEKQLRLGVETSRVKKDMDRLCTEDLVIPSTLWTWTEQEVGKAHEKLADNPKKVVKPPVEQTEDPTPPSLFSEDTLFHAGLCCEAISISNRGNPLAFFQSKKPHHNFKEISFSQPRDNITPYLIAKQNDIIYVAFRSTSSVSEWTQTALSFNEGLKQQSNQIPLRFFMDELLNNRKIVLTGFSFGGMLACCVAAQLWYKTPASQDFLLERVICITFGQPFLQNNMVDEKISICPQFEQSIHSVFNKDDVIPLVLSYVHEEESKLPKMPPPPKVPALVGPSEAKTPTKTHRGGLFSVPFVKAFLQRLAVLQDNGSEQSAAIEWLQRALQNLATYHDQNKCTLYGNCYVMSREKEKGITWQHQPKQLAAIELSQHTKQLADQLDGSLFHKHTADAYMPLIYRSYLDKYKLPNRGKARKEVADVDTLKPNVTGLQLHEYPPDEVVLILQGENLWFSYKVSIEEKGSFKYEFLIQAENTTEFTITFQAELGKYSVLEGKKVKVALYSHFSSPIRQSIDIIKEPHDFNVRQMQLARYTPRQVIQLGYLCALLEQREKRTVSKRFRAITHFLEEAENIVPVEGVFDAIVCGSNEISLECANALKKRKLTLEPSEMMIKGALRASIRAHTGCNGLVIDRFLPSARSIKLILQAAVWWLHSIQEQGYQTPLPQQVIAAQIVGFVQSAYKQPFQSQAKPKRRQTMSTSSRVKSQSHQASQKEKKNSDAVQTRNPPASARQQRMFQFEMMVPVALPIFLDPSHDLLPPYIRKFLDKCLKDLVEHRKTNQCIYYGGELSILSTVDISEVYGVSTTSSASHFKSPIDVLREGLKSISTYTDTVEMSGTSQLPNELMLSLIEKIYNHDVAVCASLLGAFMEQQIRIPMICTAKDTAEMLTSKEAPVAVGVWALFSQNLATLKAKLESGKRDKLIVEIREYIEGITQQLPENENKMYAGKLQFLLQGMQDIVTAGSQYISYSLEHQICRKLDRSTTLHALISEWDTIFKNDALSLIGESHRPLVARWLKWTILIHDLREALAQHTCIGVTGLVNSGKSLLVKDLFKIEKVKVGIRSAKHTTIPLLYNMEGSIEGLDIIDFPGFDDSEHTVPEMAGLLLSLAQIIVFVVDIKRASSDAVRAWLQLLTRNGVPVHICLTHADELYSECAEEGKIGSIPEELERIRKKLRLDAHRTKDVAFYSFKQTSCDVSAEELRKVGVNSSADVGNWLVEILKTKFKQRELADKLKDFMQKN